MPNIRRFSSGDEAVLMARNIKTLASHYGLTTGTEIANKVGLPPPTYYQRMRRPWEWRLSEIAAVAEGLGTTIQWLFTDHTDVFRGKE